MEQRIKLNLEQIEVVTLLDELTAILGPAAQDQWGIDGRSLVLRSEASQTLIPEVQAALETHQSSTASLDRAKEGAKRELFKLAERKGLQPYKNITRAEADSWPSKGTEFDAWSLNTNATCPILSQEAQHRGVTLGDYMNLKVGPKVMQYRAFVAALTAAQAILEEEILALADEAALRQWEEGMRASFTSQFISLLPI